MKTLCIILTLSVLALADSISFYEENWGKEERYADEIYDSMAIKFDQNALTRFLYNSIITGSDPVANPDHHHNTPNESSINQYSGYIIDSVVITTTKEYIKNRSDSLNNAANDSLTFEENFSLNVNRFQEYVTLQTSEMIIRNAIGIVAGDTLVPYKVEEAERYLRSQPYIQDVRIVPTPIGNNHVRLHVIKREQFPYSMSIRTKDFKAFEIGIQSKNFARIGGLFNNYLTYDDTQSQPLGYRGTIGFTNLGKSYHYVTVSGAVQSAIDQLKVNVGRGFVVRSVKNAWGTELAITTEEIISDDNSPSSTQSNYQDLWFGHAFHRARSETQSLFLSARYKRHRFTRRPQVSFSENVSSHNSDLLLSSFTASDVHYFRSKMILSFGSTEDVPIGILFQINGGYDFAEFLERPYFDVRLAHGAYYEHVGYISWQFSMSNYLRNNIPEDQLYSVQLFYYSPLMTMGNSRLRFLLQANYLEQSNPLRRGKLNIKESIRYFPESIEREDGNVRMSLKFEPTLFLPWSIAGFRTAPFLFTDFALLTDELTQLDEELLYSGFGGGLRIRNERLIVNTFEIAGGYYPPHGSSEAEWAFSFKTSIDKVFTLFSVGAPSTVTEN